MYTGGRRTNNGRHRRAIERDISSLSAARAYRRSALISHAHAPARARARARTRARTRTHALPLTGELVVSSADVADDLDD